MLHITIAFKKRKMKKSVGYRFIGMDNIHKIRSLEDTRSCKHGQT